MGEAVKVQVVPNHFPKMEMRDLEDLLTSECCAATYCKLSLCSVEC